MTTARMKTSSAASTASGMRDDDALDHVGGVLARVDRLLEQAVDLLPLDHVERVAAVGEQLGHGDARDPVALVLEPMDLDPVRLDLLEGVQLLERTHQLLALLDD